MFNGRNNEPVMQHQCVRPVAYRIVWLVFRASSFYLILGCALALLSATMPAALFAQKIQGTPWTGQPGITESVATIMAREKKEAPGRKNTLQSKKRGSLPQGPPDEAGAPDNSQLPPASSDGGKGKANQQQNSTQQSPFIAEAILSDQPFT